MRAMPCHAGALFCPRDQNVTQGSGPVVRARREGIVAQPATGGPTDQPTNWPSGRHPARGQTDLQSQTALPSDQQVAAKPAVRVTLGGPVTLQQRTTPIAYMQPWAHHGRTMDTHTILKRRRAPPSSPPPTNHSVAIAIGRQRGLACRQLLARNRPIDYFLSLSPSPRLVRLPVRCDLAPVLPVHTETWSNACEYDADGKSKRVVSKRRGSCPETCIQHYAPR